MDLESKLHQAAVQASKGGASFEGFVQVSESVPGKISWQGYVSVFKSRGGRVYAWEARPGEFAASLQTPEIASPAGAVRAWLVSQGQDRAN
jgi:hypothetical protein